MPIDIHHWNSYRPKNALVDARRVSEPGVIVRTPTGERIADKGDWVVEDRFGQRFVFKDAGFHREYELVDEET
jgi:hypothetical protein